MDPNVFETANAGFAQVMYEEFLRDPASVDAEWRLLFESGVIGEAPALNGGGAVAPEPAAPAAQPPAEATPSAPAETASASAAPIKGPAARLVQNMNESLTVPTATTFRELPVARLENARKALKAALSHSAQKTSQDNASALASLNGARNLLAAQGLDLHDVEVVIRVAARPGSRRARAA